MSDLSSQTPISMTKAQAIYGIFFIPFHSVLLPLAFSSVYAKIMVPAGIILSEATINLVLYSMLAERARRFLTGPRGALLINKASALVFFAIGILVLFFAVRSYFSA